MQFSDTLTNFAGGPSPSAFAAACPSCCRPMDANCGCIFEIPHLQPPGSLLFQTQNWESAMNFTGNSVELTPRVASPQLPESDEEIYPTRKRQCVCKEDGESRAAVGHRGTASDPQSVYARQRRERINERLKVLQNLIPNGTKVDISTMLEQAYHYVKFLQFQIKLLSSDEHWRHAPVSYESVRAALEDSNL